MTCKHEKLITPNKELCLSVKQYTSILSVEVVMYCRFNARRKQPKLLMGQMMHPRFFDINIKPCLQPILLEALAIILVTLSIKT